MESDNCLICYSNCDTKLSCGHYYHHHCFKDYLNECKKSSCCYCFKVFNETDYSLMKYNSNQYLFNAIGNKEYEKIFNLINLGVDINAKNNINMTPLMYALLHCNDSKVIYKLIELGADIHATDKYYNTTLWYAIKYYDDLKVIGKLLSLGAVINDRDFWDKLKKLADYD